MGKSYGRKEGEHGGHESLSERVKGFFLIALSMVGLTAALVRRTSSPRRIAARWVH
ncbi:MAG: hypothetical protein VW390_06775 [Gammaproteobacteria bacterium]|jgi:hypothetical protein